jgi:hypothetical protein
LFTGNEGHRILGPREAVIAVHNDRGVATLPFDRLSPVLRSGWSGELRANFYSQWLWAVMRARARTGERYVARKGLAGQIAYAATLGGNVLYEWRLDLCGQAVVLGLA